MENAKENIVRHVGLGHWEGHKCGGVFFYYLLKKTPNIASQVYTKCAEQREGEKGQICMK